MEPQASHGIRAKKSQNIKEEINGGIPIRGDEARISLQQCACDPDPKSEGEVHVHMFRVQPPCGENHAGIAVALAIFPGIWENGNMQGISTREIH